LPKLSSPTRAMQSEHSHPTTSRVLPSPLPQMTSQTSLSLSSGKMQTGTPSALQRPSISDRLHRPVPAARAAAAQGAPVLLPAVPQRQQVAAASSAAAAGVSAASSVAEEGVAA